jgi:hypothetical protein
MTAGVRHEVSMNAPENDNRRNSTHDSPIVVRTSGLLFSDREADWRSAPQWGHNTETPLAGFEV